MIDIKAERLHPVPEALAALHINPSRATRYRWVSGAGVRGGIRDSLHWWHPPHVTQAVGRFVERLNSQPRNNAVQGRRGEQGTSESV